MKLIRELRIGPPKSAKTVMTVGTYPKPMLVKNFDKDGLDVIPNRIFSKEECAQHGYSPIDICFNDIVEIEPKDLITYCKMPREKLPKVLLVNYWKLNDFQMTEEFIPYATDKAYKAFVEGVNYLKMFGCPWATYVLDSTTSLFEAMKSSVAKNQNSMLSDARKWSPAIGGKVMQHISVLNSLPNTHCVYLAHTHIDKNEKTGEISTLPLGPGGFSEQVGGIVSQYLYATTEDGTAKVWTKPKGNVKAIGCRWPAGLPGVCGADFKSIYGKELSV